MMIGTGYAPDMFYWANSIGEEGLEASEDACGQLNSRLNELIREMGRNLDCYDSESFKEIKSILKEKSEYIDNVLLSCKSDSHLRELYRNQIIRIEQSVATVFNLCEDETPFAVLQQDYYHGRALKKILKVLSDSCPEGEEMPTLQELAIRYSGDLLNEACERRSEDSNIFCFYLLRPSTSVVGTQVTLSYMLTSKVGDVGNTRLTCYEDSNSGKKHWKFKLMNQQTRKYKTVHRHKLGSIIKQFFEALGRKEDDEIVPIKELTDDRAAQYAQKYMNHKHSE